MYCHGDFHCEGSWTRNYDKIFHFLDVGKYVSSSNRRFWTSFLTIKIRVKFLLYNFHPFEIGHKMQVWQWPRLAKIRWRTVIYRKEIIKKNGYPLPNRQILKNMFSVYESHSPLVDYLSASFFSDQPFTLQISATLIFLPFIYWIPFTIIVFHQMILRNSPCFLLWHARL